MIFIRHIRLYLGITCRIQSYVRVVVGTYFKRDGVYDGRLFSWASCNISGAEFQELLVQRKLIFNSHIFAHWHTSAGIPLINIADFEFHYYYLLFPRIIGSKTFRLWRSNRRGWTQMYAGLLIWRTTGIIKYSLPRSDNWGLFQSCVNASHLLTNW